MFSIRRPRDNRKLGEVRTSFLILRIASHHAARALLAQRGQADVVTLGAFLDSHRFAGDVVDAYLIPLAAAIWSKPCE